MSAARRMTMVLCTLGCLAAASGANPGTAEPLLEELACLEQQASLVRSARATFNVTYLPTTPDEMRRIGLYYRLRDEEYRAGSHFWTEQQTRRRSYRSTWLRKGSKEREERANVARPAVTETIVFDGELVKTLDNTPFRSALNIAPPSFQWVHQNRIQPFAFALEFRAMGHSDMIRRSTDRRATRRTLAEGTRTEIIVRHPVEDRLTLRLVFDEKHRLLEREAILTRGTGPIVLDNGQPAVYSRHEFSGHRPYDDGRGETIWFPSKAILRYYMGTLPDGSPVQSHAIQVEISEIEFNLDIAEEKFNLQPPAGTPVYDHREDSFSSMPLTY